MSDEPFNPKPKKPKPIREKRIERDHKQRVKAGGGWSLKWVSPGTSGVPDDIDLHGVESMMAVAALHGHLMTTSEAETILAAAITFTECKAPGKQPTPLQARVHERLRALGFTVNVVDQLRK
jgi:hypothetical protein